MNQHDLLSRSIDVGKDMTQWTQERVEAFLRDLASNAEDQAAQAQQLIADLVERSLSNTESLVETLDREIRAQLNAVGVATKTDIARLERRIEAVLGRKPPTRAGAAAKTTATTKAPATTAPATTASATKVSATKAPAKRAPATKKAPAKQAPAKKASAAKKAPAKKAPAKKASAKKASAAKKAPAKKASAKKAPAKKASAKKAPAKKVPAAAGSTD